MEYLIEMALLRKSKTGLPVNIWIDEMGSARNVKHNIPRLKIQNDYNSNRTDNTLSIEISENPKILSGMQNIKDKDMNIIYDFIKRNLDLLLKHWNEEIDTDELKELLEYK